MSGAERGCSPNNDLLWYNFLSKGGGGGATPATLPKSANDIHIILNIVYLRSFVSEEINKQFINLRLLF